MVDSFSNRSGSIRYKSNRQSLDTFIQNFDKFYSENLVRANLQILLCRKDQFVGTKALNCALKFVAMALSKKKTRRVCKEHIEYILF